MAGECKNYVCTRCQEPHHACMCDPQRCRGEDCTTDIWWCKTPSGKSIPVEADGTAHFANCVNAQDFRKPKQGDQT